MHLTQALKRITIQNTELWTPKGVLHPTRFYKELNVTAILSANSKADRLSAICLLTNLASN